MIPGIRHIARSSVRFNRKSILYQVLIISVLAAVITGSLLTGTSVRQSLKSIAGARLGNTGLVVSSGVRYFSPDLSKRLSESNIRNSAILELKGFCQAMSSQQSAGNVSILAVDSGFFKFHGFDLKIEKGTAAVNRKLADVAGLKPGDEIIIRSGEMSDIPSDAPFAPEKGSGISFVRTVGIILDDNELGNFGLSISQVSGSNIFIGLNDLGDTGIRNDRVNRIVVDRNQELSSEELGSQVRAILKPSDIGLELRVSAKTGHTEIISGRVFIDSAMIAAIDSVIPASEPVLTYLANSIASKTGKSTPYSFVSAIPDRLYPEIAGGGIIINDWLSDDIGASEGDTIQMKWYAPDSLNSLVERQVNLRIGKVMEMKGIWADSLLMPLFPGIAGSESCSDWDAGVPIELGDIRDKDEDYWNRYAGTPKAFISYTDGKSFWGSNYGPATSIRFPSSFTAEDIEARLTGALDPAISGLQINDLWNESLRAADEGVDFSTLFISLGFFMIVAACLLLFMSAAAYLESKKEQIRLLFALGFTRSKTEKLLAAESVLIALTGSMAGALLGYVVSVLITAALNSVWIGAVQTSTIEPYFGFVPILTGFAASFCLALLFLYIRLKRFLTMLSRREREMTLTSIRKTGKVPVIVLFALSVLFLSLGLTSEKNETVFFFATGILLFSTLLLLVLSHLTGFEGRNNSISLSRSFYAYNPSQAMAPLLFIAAGIFSVFITSANRMNFSDSHLESKGGSGGFLLWGETSVPVMENMNTPNGRTNLGIDGPDTESLYFTQARKLAGNDASCLNLNHITAPPLLGLDPEDFIDRGAFSFAGQLKGAKFANPWEALNIEASDNTIYGIADQTVIQWGLKLSLGDTIVLRSEIGQPVRIVLAAGLKPSVFQGHLIISQKNLSRYFPSISGTSVFLASGSPDKTGIYKEVLEARLEMYGVQMESVSDRLAGFYKVTNTYLSVFAVFGAFGMITGVAGLGFVLLRSYSQRKREFALMLASGFSLRIIRKMLMSEQLAILSAGIFTGVISAIVATYPSIANNPEIPWIFLSTMIAAIAASGTLALLFALRMIDASSLTSSLKKE